MAINTKIAGLHLDSYVINASGPCCTTLKELVDIAESESSAIVMKSCTILPRIGNPEPRYARLPYGSIQSMGLPNLGYREYVRFSSQLKRYKKPVIASIAGLSIDEYVSMVESFNKSDVDMIEVNLSCPNLEEKPIIGYDEIQAGRLLEIISLSAEKPIGIKLPPYYDIIQYKKMAEIIIKHNISFITCINSIPNTLVIDPDTDSPIIRPKNGLGGLCGGYIKPVALANVRTFYELLGNEISIFGVGGISSGRDAFEFLLAGADAVQVATQFEKEGTGCFERINSELGEIMHIKGYNSISQTKGNLNYKWTV